MRKIIYGFTSILFAAAVFAGTANAQMGAIAAVDEPAAKFGASEGGGSVAAGKANATAPKQTTSSRRTRATTSRNRTAAKTTTSSAAARQKKASAKYDGFVIGDKYVFMNFEVISGDKPYHTRVAKAAGATGLVQVEVLIDEDGSVLSAKARTGNKLLWPEAERAALSSKFNRPSVYGKPARAIGFLVYRFGAAETSDEY
ncbi:MAG: hypothetical protein QUS14_06000 [Pyrinomonadaceae bacterium]|nr:hypothetical protein [Pyrinomonadaceae bacterium]